MAAMLYHFHILERVYQFPFLELVVAVEPIEGLPMP
jgi:hypothetical protein